MKLDDGIPAIPLWIDGHAYFNVFEEFIDIREADGAVNYRVPKCGTEEVARALASACDLQPTWGEEGEQRGRLVGELAALLDQFGGDFAKLITRETGKDFAVSRAEVDRAVALLREAASAVDPGNGSVQAVYSDAADPLASAAVGLARAWADGDTAVVLSDARAPSVLFAFAELSARVDFPSGALCLLHGDAATRQDLERALGG